MHRYLSTAERLSSSVSPELSGEASPQTMAELIHGAHADELGARELKRAARAAGDLLGSYGVDQSKIVSEESLRKSVQSAVQVRWKSVKHKAVA